MEEDRYEEANESTIAWAKLVRKKMALRVGSLKLKDRRALQKNAWNKSKQPEYKPLVNSLGANFKREYGNIIRINFRFIRHGIFFERGAGRNRRLGTAPKPWLFPILDPAIDALAEMLAKNYADIVSGELKLTIPGIITKRVRIVEKNT
jgi:hypothetical protein